MNQLDNIKSGGYAEREGNQLAQTPNPWSAFVQSLPPPRSAIRHRPSAIVIKKQQKRLNVLQEWLPPSTLDEASAFSGNLPEPSLWSSKDIRKLLDIICGTRPSDPTHIVACIAHACRSLKHYSSRRMAAICDEVSGAKASLSLEEEEIVMYGFAVSREVKLWLQEQIEVKDTEEKAECAVSGLLDEPAVDAPSTAPTAPVADGIHCDGTSTEQCIVLAPVGVELVPATVPTSPVVEEVVLVRGAISSHAALIEQSATSAAAEGEVGDHDGGSGNDRCTWQSCRLQQRALAATTPAQSAGPVDAQAAACDSLVSVLSDMSVDAARADSRPAAAAPVRPFLLSSPSAHAHSLFASRTHYALMENKCKSCKVDHDDVLWAIGELTDAMSRNVIKGSNRVFKVCGTIRIRIAYAFERLREHFLELAALGCMSAPSGLEHLYHLHPKDKIGKCRQCRGDREDVEEELAALERLLDACGVKDVAGWRECNLEHKPEHRRIMRVVCRLRAHFHDLRLALHCVAAPPTYPALPVPSALAPAPLHEWPVVTFDGPLPSCVMNAPGCSSSPLPPPTAAASAESTERALREELESAHARSALYETQLLSILQVLQEHNIHPQHPAPLSVLVARGELLRMVRALAQSHPVEHPSG